MRIAGAVPSPETLARWTRIVPIPLSDCYWIEAVIHASEASGKMERMHVRLWTAGSCLDKWIFAGGRSKMVN
jgi:hypothetical protein